MSVSDSDHEKFKFSGREKLFGEKEPKKPDKTKTDVIQQDTEYNHFTKLLQSLAGCYHHEVNNDVPDP